MDSRIRISEVQILHHYCHSRRKKTRKNKTKKSGGEVYWMGHPEVVTTVDGFTNPFEKIVVKLDHFPSRDEKKHI